MKQILLFFTLLGVFASCGGSISGGSGSGEAPKPVKPISFGVVTLTVSHRNVTELDVEFYGRVEFGESYAATEFGVAYSTIPNFTIEDAEKLLITNVFGTDYSVSASCLEPGTTYYYASFIKKENIYKCSEVKSFTTAPHPYTHQADLNISSATDLSSSGSANCYIVSKSGTYKFKAVKGNSSTSVGSVASVSILWETFGTSTTPKILDLISAFCYKDGYIAFQTADTFKEGNAVIAAKDADGNILWSWHIWLTDQPQGQEYYNNAGTMMDRNLGATSATPGDVGALGLLYQWGRKDPFLGFSSIDDWGVAKSTITWPSAVESDSRNGTIEYAISHPTTYITIPYLTDGDLRYSDSFDWQYSSRDTTLWATSDKAKSIYDPCPAGWRVPDGGKDGVWSKALGSSSDFKHSYNSSKGGMNFSSKFGSASTIWYPASGFRYVDGGLFCVGDNGYYWSASPGSCDSNGAYGLNFGSNGSVGPSGSSIRAGGLAVRCVRESK